jgi:hypothetical protein
LRKIVASAAAIDFSSSLTCCGLALPLVAFIAWPTSALNAFSLPARNSSTDFGVGGEHLVDDRLDRAGVGDLLEALGFSMISSADSAASAFAVPQRLEHLLGDLARDRVVGDARDQAAELRGD